MNPGRRYDTAQAGEYLGHAANTLAKWRVQGRGPRFRKQGSRVYYYEHDLDRWIETCARTSTSDPGPVPLTASSPEGLG